MPYYYNENDEKIGPIRNRELKQLVRQGTIASETKVELDDGQVVKARKLVGYPFSDSEQPKPTPFDSSIATNPPTTSTSNPPPQPTGVNPFDTSRPLLPTPIGTNPFGNNPPPPSQPTGKNLFGNNPFQPTPPPPRKSLLGIMVAMMNATMGFVASTVGLILALVLAAFVCVLLYSLVVLTGTIPPPPAGHWLEKIIFFDISHLPSYRQKEPVEEQEPEDKQKPVEEQEPVDKQEAKDAPASPPSKVNVFALDPPVDNMPIGGGSSSSRGRSSSSVRGGSVRDRGSVALATVNVTGTVMLDGKPLAGASVRFSPKTEGQGHPGFGTTDEKGRYQLETLQGRAGAGTTPGEYLVTISKVEVDPNAPPPAPGYPPRTRSVIPTKYAQTDTSGLTATVENAISNVFDFEFKSN